LIVAAMSGAMLTTSASRVLRGHLHPSGVRCDDHGTGWQVVLYREPGIRCAAEENELARRQRRQGQALWGARVRAALRAAAARSRGPFVRAAFRADAERWAIVRRLDAVLA
jgi:hypothetical protein